MTTFEILDAVNARLLEKWPERTVYVDVCPMDFDRPSFWLRVEKFEQSDANRFMVRRDLLLYLTLYDEKDDHYDASWYRLAGETEEAVKLLTPPLSIGARRIRPDLKALPRDPDAAYLQLAFSWLNQRTDPGNTTPAADSFELSVQAK